MEEKVGGQAKLWSRVRQETDSRKPGTFTFPVFFFELHESFDPLWLRSANRIRSNQPPLWSGNVSEFP
jgi:hypothetical protein